jgi:hypothetical protein
LEFLRQDHMATAPIQETLARLADLAARLESGAQNLPATLPVKTDSKR